MTAPIPADVQAAFCRVLCDEWARAGITDAVVSPGSRSTPLLRALDDSGLRVHVVLDERSAGFVALGLGLSSGRPAVVVTTSGTASVELHPAVVEAGQAGVPLLAVTTDRPPELHDVGAPQTVEQRDLFGGVVRWACDPGPADLASAASWRSVASRSVAEALAGGASRRPGPVHLNLPFREPLIGDADRVVVPPGRTDGAPWHAAFVGPAVPLPSGVGGLPAVPLPAPVGDLLRGRGLIVAGAASGVGGSGSGALAMAERLGWPLLADPRSGCRVPHPLVVSSADALLRVPEFVAQALPDVVVRVGLPAASKVLGQWLAGLPAEVPQIVIDPGGAWADPDRRASHVVIDEPLAIAAGLSAWPTPEFPGRDEAWVSFWRTADDAAQSAMDTLLGRGGELELSEPAIARAVLAAVPAGGQLVVSSSMPVRDVEWYGAPRRDVRGLANRGANGIDGVISTALGAALASPTPTTLLIGDLAFLYDAGALLWAAHRDAPLTMVVVDNAGGGIFSFLSQRSAESPERFERYWGTPHGVDLVAVAGAYGVPAIELVDREALDAFLEASSGGVRVGVVRSSRDANVDAHGQIHAAVADAVASARSVH